MSGPCKVETNVSSSDVPLVDFVKIDPEAPTGFYEYEAAGLHWLAAAAGAPVVPVVDVMPGKITVPEYDVCEPDAEAAFEFGYRLARTHAAGAPWFGAPPDGWEGNGFVGHLDLPLAIYDTSMTFPEYFVEYRIEPFLRLAADEGIFNLSEVAEVTDFMDLVVNGSLLPENIRPDRLHGDLWSGNMIWTPDQGVMLVDPAAHGGFGESDLAMLQLFGCPNYEDIFNGYNEASPIARGWEQRFLALQVHPLLVHTLFFGDAYGEHVMSAVRRFV